MRFQIDQRFDAGPAAVAAAYADPALYEAFQVLPKVSRPEVLSHHVDDGVVTMQIQHRFSGDLSAAVRAVLDPDRLTWVEHATHDLATRTTTFRLVPDHYGDRFRCSGSYRFEAADGGGTVRRCEGEIRVKALLVAGAVEGAIVSGLREHLAAEVAVVEAFLAG